MAEQTRSYSIEIDDQATGRVTLFTFVEVTADEPQTVIAEFRRLLARVTGIAAIDRLASTRPS